jgi:endonuclease/exonuclease/phosphatase family metal-dependent hydrolase
MSVPFRFTVCTYNIWTTTRWPERRDALATFASTVAPDILCLQEVQPNSLAALDESLPKHRRVDDPFPGWSNEGNVYWRDDLFELVEHLTPDVGILEPLRRLFAVRLRLRHEPDVTLLVATAHFTWDGHEIVRSTHRNVRVAQAQATVDALDRHRRPAEPQLFMGDLNDATTPVRVLLDAEFADCFSAVGQTSSSTHPAQPTAAGVPSTIDWLMSRGPVRPLLGHVIDFYVGDLAPSDHKPVIAVYELA